MTPVTLCGTDYFWHTCSWCPSFFWQQAGDGGLCHKCRVAY